MYLAMTALDCGYADPRWGGYREIREAGGHVREGEKGTPIMYVDWRQRRPVRDGHGNPALDGEGRPKLEWVQRDRPLVRLRYVFNVEQTEGLELRSLQVAAPEWEGLERAEALIRNSGIRVDHVADDRSYYNFFENRVMLPERSQFPSPSAYTHTALHELGHATGHPSRMNRPTFVNRGGFGSETYAREELRAEIGAMMTGERLGVGHEPRHGTAYVGAWIKVLESDPKEMRAAAVDAQRISDWLIARERGRTLSGDKAEHERTGDAATSSAARERAMALPASVGTAARGAPAMSEELRTVLRDMGAAGYGRGFGDAAAGLASRAPSNPERATDRGPGDAAQSLLDDATAKGYLRGYDDSIRGASRADAAVRRHQVSYVKEVTAVDGGAQAELHYAPRRAPAQDPKRSPRAVPVPRAASPVERDAPLRGRGRSSQVFSRAAGGERQRDIGPGR